MGNDKTLDGERGGFFSFDFSSEVFILIILNTSGYRKMNPMIVKTHFLNQIVSYFLNLIGKKNTYQIIVTGKDYSKLTILFGLITYEKGDKRMIEITGTEKYLDNIITKLDKQNFKVRSVIKVIDHK
jgi:hypothetical protein